ncbi:DUF2726 domain-containing protein [Sphingomonas sp.]|uniref:DUF2726 domain-containing protein n=1 Tax=Sphingomonas sp. TaxID=28214 RepID=UPI003B0084E9
MGALLATIGPFEIAVFLVVFVLLAAWLYLPQPTRPGRLWEDSRPSSRPRRGSSPNSAARWRAAGRGEVVRLSSPIEPRIIDAAPTLAAPNFAAPSPAPGVIDPAEQLRAVMAAPFTAKRVLSRTEANVMLAAEAAIAEAGLSWRVLAQVSLGEVLASSDKAAFNAINAKRVDLLIVSGISEPLAAIEYQGEGHWQGTAPARDAVKKEALRRAGVGYIEVTPAHGPDDLRREVARLAMTLAAAGRLREADSAHRGRPGGGADAGQAGDRAGVGGPRAA